MSSLASGEPLRVLLVSPHARQREEVGDALQAAGEHRYYWVSQPDLALTRAQGLAPHVIFVDDDLGDVDPAVLIEHLVQVLPHSAVLLLVAPEALTLAQAAVFAGARTFIQKPVKSDNLISTLRQVLGRRIEVQQPTVRQTATTGRVIVFCASKGGTGRTTMAINTAVCLRENLRESVVVVDADYAAPAIDVALNLRGQRDIRDLLPKLNQLDTDLISSVLATHTSGVRVLLAPPPDSLDYPPTLPQVQQITSWLKRMFPWVLVDLGLPLNEAAYAFLDGADCAVMSVLPEMVGMRNTKVMLAQFEARKYRPGKVWPVLNREGLLGGVKKPDVAEYLVRELRFAIPNDQDFATETINRGVPMVIARRRRPVAQAYRKLAAMLAEDRKVEAAQLASRPVLPSMSESEIKPPISGGTSSESASSAFSPAPDGARAFDSRSAPAAPSTPASISEPAETPDIPDAPVEPSAQAPVPATAMPLDVPAAPTEPSSLGPVPAAVRASDPPEKSVEPPGFTAPPAAAEASDSPVASVATSAPAPVSGSAMTPDAPAAFSEPPALGPAAVAARAFDSPTKPIAPSVLASAPAAAKTSDGRSTPFEQPTRVSAPAAAEASDSRVAPTATLVAAAAPIPAQTSDRQNATSASWASPPVPAPAMPAPASIPLSASRDIAEPSPDSAAPTASPVNAATPRPNLPKISWRDRLRWSLAAPRLYDPDMSWLDRLRWSLAAPQARRIILTTVILLVLLAVLAFIVPRALASATTRDSMKPSSATRVAMVIESSRMAATGPGSLTADNT